MHELYSHVVGLFEQTHKILLGIRHVDLGILKAECRLPLPHDAVDVGLCSLRGPLRVGHAHHQNVEAILLPAFLLVILVDRCVESTAAGPADLVVDGAALVSHCQHVVNRKAFESLFFQAHAQHVSCACRGKSGMNLSELLAQCSQLVVRTRHSASPAHAFHPLRNRGLAIPWP